MFTFVLAATAALSGVKARSSMLSFTARESLSVCADAAAALHVIRNIAFAKACKSLFIGVPVNMDLSPQN